MHLQTAFDDPLTGNAEELHRPSRIAGRAPEQRGAPFRHASLFLRSERQLRPAAVPRPPDARSLPLLRDADHGRPQQAVLDFVPRLQFLHDGPGGMFFVGFHFHHGLMCVRIERLPDALHA